MDLGPFQAGCFKVQDQITAKGIAIKVGTADAPATVLFDPELMRVSAAWAGGFLKWPRGRGGLEGQIAPDGELRMRTGYAAGWSDGEITDDPRPQHQGNLPRKTAKWRGLYVHGDKVLLSYTVGVTPVLELPGYDAEAKTFTRTFAMPKIAGALTLLVAELAGSTGTATGSGASLVSEDAAQSIVANVIGAPAGAKLAVANGRITLKLPPQTAPATFQIGIWSGAKAEAPETLAGLKQPGAGELEALTKGGPAHWGEPLVTTGKLGTGDGPYVVDEITLPEPNPFKSWLRPGGHDFFANGDAALVNLSGDVWHVGGLDPKLESVKWKRVATGLFQPLGCKVVDGKVYVLGRDQITRLHDVNNDGETDFYENFNNDCVATDNYHEFALDLQRDSAGNFYYAKGSPWTPTSQSPHQGTMLRVSKDGSKLEVIATGLRAPNGLGMGPKDFLTCSDNQGHWMPANRLNVIRPGGFYGMTPAAHKTLRFKAADGTEFEANPSSEEDRKKFKTEFWGKTETPRPIEGHDLPLVWMPQNVDNSPGGEVWVSGGKWGPWEGRMLHLSYGHCLLYGVAMETVEGVAQGAVIKFPFKFPSGVMRGRFQAQDGQLYVSGLNVWQSDAAKFGCFSRVRYTGKPVTMPIELHAKKEGIELVFTGPLDEASATDMENFSVERWNYQWTGAYGSPDFKVSNPQEKGKELVILDAITLSSDKKTLLLKLPEMVPCMQMKIKFKIQAADGSPVEQEIHNTIHRVPGGATAAR
ncbi:MAG: Cytochrome c [Chthoniobacter sp.]|nr:Cytochrome c [Chthoniobacter sp.]